MPHPFGLWRHYRPYQFRKGTVLRIFSFPLRSWLAFKRLEVLRAHAFGSKARWEGKDWPRDAETMIGMKRLNNLQACIVDVLRQGVPGDLIETGVWRGGATIFMRAVVKAYGDTTRTVWVAALDPSRYPADAEDRHWTADELRVSVEEVKANFAKYGLLDDQVRFLVGWFRDTLPTVPVDRFSILRLDGDMYESTMDPLRHVYPKLAVGGYIVIDDYGAVPAVQSWR